MKHIIRAKFPEETNFQSIPAKVKALIEKNPHDCFDFIIGDLEITKSKDKTIEKWSNQKRISSKKVVGEKFILQLKTKKYEVEVLKDGLCKVNETTNENIVLTFSQFVKS